MCLSTKPTSKWLFVPGLGLSRFWGPITLCADLWLRWGLKQNCSPRQELSNGMSHTTYTQGNQGDFWLLVVESQIANLTLGPFFGHNLCFKCPNRWCKPSLDIYVSRKNSLNHWVLAFAIILWTFVSPPRLQLPTWEFTWECEGSFPHTLLHSRGHENATSKLNLGPYPCKPFALVTSPRLALWQ